MNLVGFLVLLGCMGPSAMDQPKATAGKVRSEMLVSTKWLSGHLKDPKVIVLHVGDDRTDFERMHIPGALFLDENKFIDQHAGPHVEMPSVEQLTKTFSELGIKDDTRVVLYTTDWFPLAARAYLTLDYLGHDNTALLDGGLEQWLIDHQPTEKGPDSPKPAAFTAKPRPQLIAKLAEAKQIVAGEQPNEVLVDARPHSRYTDGHLSSAVNVYWKDVIVNEKEPLLLSPEELQKIYASRNIQPGKKVVTYCEVGLQASHGYFLAKYLGYDAAMYDGSFHEWEMEKQPVVKGDAPK